MMVLTKQRFVNNALDMVVWLDKEVMLFVEIVEDNEET